MAFVDNFKNHISSQVDAAVDSVFVNSHGYALTESGDITPEQQAELDTIKESLKRLIEIQVTQNLTEEQLKLYGIQIPQDAAKQSISDSSSEELIDRINSIQQGDPGRIRGINIDSDEWFSDEQFDIIRRVSKFK